MDTQRKTEVVVVTGAGAGLGRAIVQSFARRGAHIGLVSRSEERLQDAQREVEQLGARRSSCRATSPIQPQPSVPRSASKRHSGPSTSGSTTR
jgi:NADP-dependent 3-hydroxy acid dehydrogenase YdfG